MGVGLVLEPPRESSYYHPEKGIDKDALVRDALVRDALVRYDPVAFAGDGALDLAPALMVAPELRFARRWLAGELRRRRAAFRAFGGWGEIASRSDTSEHRDISD